MVEASPVQPKQKTDLQVFQENLKKTSLGVKFAKSLFSENAFSMSPAQIANAMKQLGVQVPDGVLITVDVAQIYASGAALSTAIESYNGVNSLKAVAGAGAQTVNAALLLGEKLGWIDASSDTAQVLKVGTDIALIVSSMGTNVGAWISLAMDFASFSAQNKMKAAKLAKEGLISQVRARFTPQTLAAASVFKNFQESQNLGYSDPNYLSIFGMVGKVAEVAPDLWPQYFPNFGWAPTTLWTLSSNSSSRTWYGETATDHAEFTFEAFTRMPKSQIQDVVYRGLILPYLAPYRVMRDAYADGNKASITTLAILGALTNFGFIDPSHDYSLDMKNACLTPLDFGDAVFENFLDDYDRKNRGLQKHAAVQISGVGVSPVETDFILNNLVGLSSLDNAGRMDVLASVPQVQKYLRDQFTFPELDPVSQQVAGSESDKLATEALKNSVIFKGVEVANVVRDPREVIARGIFTPQYLAQSRDWRNLKNYFAALGMIDQLSHDTWFADWIMNGKFGNLDFQDFAFLHTTAEIDQLARAIQLKMVIRQVNNLALINIANFFETTPDKLVRRPQKNGEPITYTVKG